MKAKYFAVLPMLAGMIVLAACAGAVYQPPPTMTQVATPLPPTVIPTERPAGGPQSIPECVLDAFGCAVIPPDETIKIGMAGPMTGDYAAFGADISQAGQLAIEAFGQYLDWRFELVLGDTQGDPAQAVPVAEAWVEDPTFVAVAGHIFSGETREAIPIYEAHGIPMMSPSATNPELTRLGSTVFNRLAFTDLVQAEYATAYLFDKLQVRRLAVIHDGQPYGQALAEMVTDNFQRRGGEIVAQAVIEQADGDLTETLAGILAAEPEAIYYGGYDNVAIAIVNELAQLRSGGALTEGTPEAEAAGPIFFGCDGTFGENFLVSTGVNGEGAYAASLLPPDSDAKRNFDALYTERYGVAPGAFSPYTWHGYDAVGVLIYAVKRVAILGADGNLYVPRGALVETVRTLQGYPGLTGEIGCNEVGECSTTGPSFYMIAGGEWVPAP